MSYSDAIVKGGTGAMSNKGSVTIIRANALDLPLADNTVDLVVTSPP